MTDTIDTNIDHYSVDDILVLFNIREPTIFNVKDKANAFISKMKNENKMDLMVFFEQARDKVLTYLQKIQLNEDDDEITDSISKIWEKSFMENLKGSKTRYYDNDHNAIEHQTPVEDSTVPPIIATSIITIDSQYRENILPYSSSPISGSFNTNFIFNLTNPLYKVISLALYSYQIPTTWYAFTAIAGNTFFIYNGIMLVIPDGNYSTPALVAAINLEAQKQIATSTLLVTYSTVSGRIAFTNNDTLSASVTIVFYNQSNVANFNNCGNFVLENFQTYGINTTLGWLMGDRTTADSTTGNVSVTINSGATYTLVASPATYGPKYFILSIEDYNNHRLSGGLYSITRTKTVASLTVPDYYNTIQVACKLQEGSLTQAQQYSIEQIQQNNANTNNIVGFQNRLSGPNAGSAFAMIPLEGINPLRDAGMPYVKFGGDLIMNKRSYTSPVTLQRISVSLSDDKGNLVNLHDNDWSLSLLVETRLN
jgi:hypothetical protein